MDVPTRSNSARNGHAVGALLAGLLSVATVPAAIGVTHYEDLDVLDAGVSIPLAFLLGVLALRLARTARRRTERTIGRVGGVRTTRAGRWLGILGVYAALTAALAIGIYELLNFLSD